MATASEVPRAEQRGFFSRVFYGWYIVLAGIGLHAWVATVWIYGMPLFFTPLKEDFGWSSAAIAFAFSLNRIEGSVLTPIEGWLADKYGPRKMIMVGALVMGLGFIVLGMIDTIWSFYVAMLIVAGGSSATMGVPRSWAITQWFRRLRGRAMGIGNVGGVFAGPLLVPVVWLLASHGWRTTFFVLGLCTIVVCVPLAAVYRRRPEDYGLLPDGDPVASDGPVADADHQILATPEESYTTRRALKTSAFWILAGIFAIQQFGQGAVTVHLIAYLESSDVGFTALEAASVLGFFTVLSVFGRLGGGWAMDQFGARLTMAVLLALMAVGYLILVNMTEYWMVPVYALIYGTAFGGLMTGRNVIIGTFFGRDSFGTISGIIHSATVPVGIVAPVFLGWIFDLTGTYRPGIWAIIAISVIGVPLTVLARPPRREGALARL